MNDLHEMEATKSLTGQKEAAKWHQVRERHPAERWMGNSKACGKVVGCGVDKGPNAAPLCSTVRVPSH